MQIPFSHCVDDQVSTSEDMEERGRAYLTVVALLGSIAS